MGSISPQQQRERFIAQYVIQPPVALYDIGVGPKTEWEELPKLWPNMKVYGCEPHPAIYRELLRRHFPGPLWPVAISSQASVVLHTYRNQVRRNLLGSSSIFGLPDMDGDPITARAWTLDAFDDACERPTGILLWMDIEGGELDALQSGIRLLQSGRVHYINLEVRRRPPVAGWPTAQDLNSFLKSLGYAKACDYLHCGDHWDVIYLRAPVQPWPP